ncbi:MAG: 6-bladed beta-propeller [Bacteroidales bacterium]
MKRKIIISMVLLCFMSSIQSQTLLDVYQKGMIKLTPDKSYGSHTNWNHLFDDKDKVVYGNPVGKMKSIVVSEEGEVFVGNYSKYNIYKLDKKGDFIKQFGKKGGNPGEFLYRPILHGILDNKYIFASDHQGRIQFYDLDGNFYKMVKIDYMPLQIVALKDNKIAIWGHVAYKGDVKYIVAIKDIETNKEIIVDNYFNSLTNLKAVRIKLKDGTLFSFSPTGVRDRTIIERTPEGNLIVGHNVQDKLSVYNPDGQKIQTINLQQTPKKTTAEDKEEFIQKIKQFLVEKELYEENKERLNDPDIYPGIRPVYYAIKTDYQGNMLLFHYSKEEGNSFFVYDKEGTYICETTIEPDKFEIDINARFSTFQIHPNGLYAYVSVVDSETSEIKIIRTQLK